MFFIINLKYYLILNILMDKSVKPYNPAKPKAWENKTYRIEDNIDYENINKIYADFVTLSYNEINDYFNKNYILNNRTEDGKTLFHAVLNNDGLDELEKKQILEKLIHLNVSINAPDNYNQAPLHIACKKGYNSIIQLLIDHKSMKDPVDNYGNAPIHYYIDNFIKKCKNSDMFNNKKLLITSQKKTNETIITYLLLTEILASFKKDEDLKKYKEIIIKFIDLIPYFKISYINTKEKEVNEKINKLYTNISGINIKKDVNKLVNEFNDDIYKIYDNYKLSDKNIYDVSEFNKEIDNKLSEKNKDKIKKEYEELKGNITKIKESIFPENDKEGSRNNQGLFNKSINCITMSLFLLIYIEKYINIIDRNLNSIIPPDPLLIRKITNYIKTVINVCYKKFFVTTSKPIEYYNYLEKKTIPNINKITSAGLDAKNNIKLSRTIDEKITSQFILTYNEDLNNFDVIEEIDNFNTHNNDPINLVNQDQYKYNNIHFIFKLLYKIFNENYLEINIDINNISYNNIFDIYSKYELIICVINNLTLIYKNLDTIEKDKHIKKLVTTFNEIKKIFIIKNVLDNKERDLLDENINLKLLKKYIDEMLPLLNAYNIPKLREDITRIYKQLRDLIIKYNNIIVLINELYSIKYFEEFKKYYYDDPPNNNLIHTDMIYNQFNVLNTNLFPDNMDEYIRKYIKDDNDINVENMKELYLYCDTFNYNKIYNMNNVHKPLKSTQINIDVKSPNYDIIFKKNYNTFLDNKDNFYTGYFVDDTNIINSSPRLSTHNKLYKKKFIGTMDPNPTNQHCTYLVQDKNNLNVLDNIPIVSIFNYKELLYLLMYKCKEILVKDCNKKEIFTNVLKKFQKLTESKEKLVKKENKENRKIIDNLNKLIINNDTVGDDIIITHLNDLMNVIIEHQFTLNSIEVSKILLENELFNKFHIQEYDLFINEAFNKDIMVRIKNITNNHASSFVLGDYQNINFIGDKTASNRLIQDVCINTNNIDIIKKFHFNLRVEDKNGNTIIHRLIDQYNYYAIEKLLLIDKDVITYKNHADQNAKEYLLNLLNIISKEYSKNEINNRLENYAFILENEIKAQGFTNIEINNQPKYIQVILYNCINQFNDFMWLNLYEFKNNITLSTITELKKIMVNQNPKINLIEDLIINNLTSYTDIKTKLKNMFIADKINDKISQMHKQNEDEINELNKSKIEFQNLLSIKGKKGIIDETEIKNKIKVIDTEISKKESENLNIKIVLDKITDVDAKCCNIFTIISNHKLIENLKLNFDEFSKLSKELCEDYFKILNLIYTVTKTDTKIDDKIYMCDFNYLLINIKLDKLNSNEFLNYENYFANFINTIFEDYNDLEKYEDFEINYVNYTILNIIKINLVNTISCEIYNYIVKYLVDKYLNKDNTKTKELYEKNKKEILKSIKDFINNKIYDKLNLKNPDKEYKSEKETKKLIKDHYFIGIIQRDNEDDNKEIENILKFYSFIAENVAFHYYEEITRYLNDLRKIILLLKIYNILK
jgi:hypothetical protein